MSRFNPTLASFGILFGLSASMATVAEGQGLDAIPSNARVRVDFPAAERSRFERSRFGRARAQSVVGTLEAVRADTLFLVVRSGAEALRVPRAAVRGVYLSMGRPPRWRAAFDSALLPMLVTSALGAVGASIHRRQGDPSPSEAALSSALWSGASAALLGAWHPKERWHAVITPSRERHQSR
jgi:hypothetical protein